MGGQTLLNKGQTVTKKKENPDTSHRWMRLIEECGGEMAAAYQYATQIDWLDFSNEIAGKYGNLSRWSLKRAAKRPCDKGIGHDEKVFIMHLRAMFGLEIFHPQDYRDTEDEQAILSPCLEGLLNWENGRTDDDWLMDDGE